ncbi:phospholipid-binding protein [Corynebacterium atypicum]|uniref:Phospholipid-binding protein n=1 Tax=Corynebacterium atypicum TaxID=191610 RepID=A0ABM5QMW4_9CORY|nr:YbhB/YbcL family Raf kinase inhibitor-like protein [Corynebacterium atypicum]AIG64118.1 phospholipid-binding protein [Corynebacterium atypicum]
MSNTPRYIDDRFPGPDPYAPLVDVPSFPLTSADIEQGQKLDEAQTSAANVSPELSWSELPEGTKSLAVTCFDPDTPTAAGFWHWAAFNIPADVTGLARGAGEREDLGIEGAVALRNDGGTRAYVGAAPPAGHGPHRYLFAVHAVDTEKLDIDPDATATVLGFNLNFHSLGRAIVWGWFENK